MWFCSQIGAREHYAIPRVLHRAGKLAAFYTDFWAGPFVRKFSETTNIRALRPLAARFHPQLAGASVASWNFRSLIWESSLRKDPDVYSRFIEIGRQFAVRVREALEHRPDLGSDSVFFSYDTGALEAMEWCRDRGMKCVLNQMDPGRVEVDLVREEEKTWPGWAIRGLEVPETYFIRRQSEWAAADRIVVNSVFSRDALVKQGVPADKLTVIPLSFESSYGESSTAGLRAPASGRPLSVLFLGQVILRKGIQYLIRAARMLEQENIQFHIVGPLGISAAATASAPKNVKFHGRVARDQAIVRYRQSDVFVLPTLSDGFAITQLEAMAHALPVVATPCCGSVVSDGADGFIVPARDAGALAAVFRRYLDGPELLERQRRAASEKVKQFSLDRLASNLDALEETCFARIQKAGDPPRGCVGR